MDVLLRPENSVIKITIRNSPRLLFIYQCPREEIMKGKQYIDEQVSKLGTAAPHERQQHSNKRIYSGIKHMIRVHSIKKLTILEV